MRMNVSILVSRRLSSKISNEMLRRESVTSNSSSKLDVLVSRMGREKSYDVGSGPVYQSGKEVTFELILPW